MTYYNENDSHAAAWLKELIKANLIAPGDVDERSIVDVQPDDLKPYAQCHFFAGIGGWSYALRLAGVSDGTPVWTGSCPCQPFSSAGQQRGQSDERHLWPAFRELIRGGKPSIVFGEQVASKLGRGWIAGVFADLEGMGYQRAGADLCAAGVGSPHIRQRLYWVAHAPIQRREWSLETASASRRGGAEHDCSNGRLEHAAGNGREQWRPESVGRSVGGGCGWSGFDLLSCLDGKARRVESGTFPLAHGIPGRVGLLRGYGNAIVPQVAAEFIRAAIEAIHPMTTHHPTLALRGSEGRRI